MREVKRKVLVIAVALIAVAMLATTINSVFAIEIFEHQYAGGEATIQVPDGPMINLVMYRLSGYFGRASDRIHITVATESDPETFVLVRGWEDNPDRKAFSDSLGMTGDNILVKRWQIQVIRICKTTIAWWTIPLVVPATEDTQAVTVPPGFIILKGSGDKITSVIELPVVTVEVKANYAAEGKLCCLGWRCASITGVVATDTDWNWNLPD